MGPDLRGCREIDFSFERVLFRRSRASAGLSGENFAPAKVEDRPVCLRLWPGLTRPSTPLTPATKTWIRGTSPRKTTSPRPNTNCGHGMLEAWISPDSPARKREPRVSVTCPLFKPEPAPGESRGAGLGPRFRAGKTSNGLRRRETRPLSLHMLLRRDDEIDPR
jgi:hypothetical protein